MKRQKNIKISMCIFAPNFYLIVCRTIVRVIKFSKVICEVNFYIYFKRFLFEKLEAWEYFLCYEKSNFWHLRFWNWSFLPGLWLAFSSDPILDAAFHSSLRDSIWKKFDILFRRIRSSGVNFTNILCAAFTYVSCGRSFFVPMF